MRLFAECLGYRPHLIEATLAVNHAQPLRLLARLEHALGTLENKKIAVFGLAFKPGTGDVRDSPSIAIINRLLEKNAAVCGVDPVAAENMAAVIARADKPVLFTADYKVALENAEAVILVTAWPEFIAIAPAEYPHLMKNPLVVDGRRVLDRQSLEKAGCRYLAVGLAEGGADSGWR